MISCLSPVKGTNARLAIKWLSMISTVDHPSLQRAPTEARRTTVPITWILSQSPNDKTS